MKRFRFRLESVRGLRDLAERRERERFGLAQQKAAAAFEAVRVARERRAGIALSLASSHLGSFRAVDRVGGMAALRIAERGEAEAVRLLSEAEAARDRAREEWLAARRNLQVIERLEERARLAHREAADKAEQNLLDELGSMSAARVARFV